MAQYFFYENKSAGINTQIKLTAEQEYWRQHTYRRFAYMKSSRAQNELETHWDADQKQYDGWRPPKNAGDWQSNIVPPYTTSVVESSLSELCDQTLQPQVGARFKQYIPAATVMNYVKDYAWQIGYGDFELYKAIKQLLILGTTCWQDYYWREKRKVQLIVGYDPKTGREKYKEVEHTDFDDVFGEAVNLWDVWFDPEARSVNTGPYKAQDAVRRYIMHMDRFRAMFKGTTWDKFGLVDAIKPGGDTNYYQYFKPPQGFDHTNNIEILWHWIRNPDKLVICANDVPFYVGPNPYNHKQLPFATGQDTVNPWSIYGKGQPRLLESIQDELTTIRRMRLDRQKMDIYKMIFVSNRETISDQDLIPAPMKPIYVDDPKNVQPFEYGDVNPSAYKEEMLLKEDASRVTGIDDRAQSVNKPTATATDAAIMKEATLKRLRMKIWVLTRTFLMEQIQLRVPNICQFYKTPKILEIGGTDAMEKMIKIREAAEQHRLMKEGGKFYEAQYRTIVTKNKKLNRKENGDISVVDERGDNFFMVTPDLLGPADIAFRYKLSAEPTFPLSKPLQQQKTSEYMMHPVVQLAMQTGYYDPNKMADKLTEMNDYDPEEFKKMTEESQIQKNLVDPQEMMERASKENEKMVGGETLIGTPLATAEHTQIHLAFMQSQPFKEKATPEILRVFANHIMQENTAQILRGKAMNTVPGQQPGQGGSMGGGTRNAETAGIMQGDMKNLMPEKQLGPENVPSVMGF
jgi:hypothetical protein